MRKFLVVKDEFRKFKEKEIKLPTRGTKYSAGYDFYLPNMLVIQPKSTAFIFLDVKAAMNEDEVLYLHVRSSLGVKKGIVLANTTGVIDSDYFENPDNDGNIGIALTNTTDKPILLEEGERVVQGVFHKFLVTDDDMTISERKGGFGSTSHE